MYVCIYYIILFLFLYIVVSFFKYRMFNTDIIIPHRLTNRLTKKFMPCKKNDSEAEKNNCRF